MISLKILFAILVIHWFADFILQTDEQAKGKSISMNSLLAHTFNYSLTWLVIGTIYTIIALPGNYIYGFKLFEFVGITFIIHTITDYYTSRANKELWENNNVHGFFVGIGFDQILHYVQLILTYYFLYG